MRAEAAQTLRHVPLPFTSQLAQRAQTTISYAYPMDGPGNTKS